MGINSENSKPYLYFMEPEVYNDLHDFIMSRESDIDLEEENFGGLKSVYDWICKLEDYS